MIIDRIEESIAVVEISKGEFLNVPLDHINGRARDGAVLVESETDDEYIVDETATAARSSLMEQKRRKLFRR